MKRFIVSILFVVSAQLCAKQENLIEKIKVATHRVDVTINKEFKSAYLKKDFFAEYPTINLNELDYSIVTTPFIMNVITIVWASGKKYYIDAMDYDLHESLKTVKQVFRRLYPKTKWDGQLVPRRLVHNKLDPQKVDMHKDEIALCFSGGLDSLCSSFLHRDNKQLLITVQGHYDTKIHKKERWRFVVEKNKEFAQKYGHENIFFKSNYHFFLNRKVLDFLSPEIHHWRMCAVEGIGWAGLAAPILVAKGYTKLFIASSISWDYPYPQSTNPLIDDNIRFAGVSVKNDAADMARVQKNEYVAQVCQKYTIEKPYTRVCAQLDSGHNCCECEKCIRTMLGFIAVGQDYRDYGFSASKQQVLKTMQYYFETEYITRYVSWNYQQIQSKMKKNVVAGILNKENPFVEWFLSVNLESMTGYRNRPVKKINWNDFVDVCSSIPKRLLSN